MPSATLPTHPFVYTAGDRKPVLQGLVGTTAAPVDITGYTITLKLKRPTGSSLLTKVAVITVPLSGLFEFRWNSGNLVEGLGQLAEVEIDDGTGEIETKRFLLDVTESI